MVKKKRSKEEKLRIILAGLKNESSISELCRRNGIHQNLYYRWKKKFFEGGLEALSLNRRGRAKKNQTEKENEELKKIIAELMMENRFLKKIQ